jgi:hypothetical protein
VQGSSRNHRNIILRRDVLTQKPALRNFVESIPEKKEEVDFSNLQLKNVKEVAKHKERVSIFK